MYKNYFPKEIMQRPIEMKQSPLAEIPFTNVFNFSNSTTLKSWAFMYHRFLFTFIEAYHIYNIFPPLLTSFYSIRTDVLELVLWCCTFLCRLLLLLSTLIEASHTYIVFPHILKSFCNVSFHLLVATGNSVGFVRIWNVNPQSK